MKVILRKDVKNLGTVGDVVEVKPGYGRNFLLPQGLAELATPGAIKNWQLGAERRAKKIEADLKAAQAVAAKLKDVVLTFNKSVNADGVVFGSVNKADIYKALTELGHTVAKENIELDMPIKKLGETDVNIYFKPTVSAVIKVKIEPVVVEAK
ncbi:large subunit ribosomal protein L9 [Elusimicrobium simillimum]|uniref:50S ribosomal protein L9 n=1 Tax=Elusimicrobium simillimum TaxID=3143438 RepID=UPI003C6EEF37